MSAADEMPWSRTAASPRPWTAARVPGGRTWRVVAADGYPVVPAGLSEHDARAVADHVVEDDAPPGAPAWWSVERRDRGHAAHTVVAGAADACRAVYDAAELAPGDALVLTRDGAVVRERRGPRATEAPTTPPREDHDHADR